jgi:HK97 family phage prohead protease
MKEMNVIHRNLDLREVKFSLNSDNRTFTGYGAVFNNIDENGDVFLPGTFTKTIAVAEKTGLWPAMLLQHGGITLSSDGMMPIGIWTKIEEDNYGLKVAGKLADTRRANEVYALMKMEPRPAITGLSVGYIAKDYTFGNKPSDARRVITEAKLVEISPVTFPANEKARVMQVKNIENFETLSEAESCLRDAGGFSRTEAKQLVAIIKNTIQRDAVDRSRDIASVIAKNVAILRGAK